MKILVTGAAGFIGFHLAKKLINLGNQVVGFDSLNDYYAPALKLRRLEVLSSEVNSKYFTFVKGDLSDRYALTALFKDYNFDAVVNLAAQAGVRYSLTNPHDYIDSNIVGFVNILEECRNHKVKHLVYASSSSVYGMNTKQPFSTDDQTDYPVSLYAATKKSNELMAHTYSHLFRIPTTGLRFFTVYGPYGRPDMAYYKFTKSIINGEPIDLFNNGDMKRDFTYIDDIVEGLIRVIQRVPSEDENMHSKARPPCKIYNIGNNNPVPLSEFVKAIEEACGRVARCNLLPMQPGDVPTTYADVDDLISDIGFQPATDIKDGVKKFVDWYLSDVNVHQSGAWSSGAHE